MTVISFEIQSQIGTVTEAQVGLQPTATSRLRLTATHLMVDLGTLTTGKRVPEAFRPVVSVSQPKDVAVTYGFYPSSGLRSLRATEPGLHTLQQSQELVPGSLHPEGTGTLWWRLDCWVGLKPTVWMQDLLLGLELLADGERRFQGNCQELKPRGGQRPPGDPTVGP